MSAAEQKDLGSAAWKAENFPKAIEHFSNAIDLTSDKEILKILYSNRSACHLKVKQNALALVDANKCIEIDDKWTKGYMRKGDALYADQKLTDAYNAYNAGLRVDGKDELLMKKSEQVMNVIAGQSAGTSSGRGWGSSQSSSSWDSSATGAAAPVSPPLPGTMGKIQSYRLGNFDVFDVPCLTSFLCSRYFMLINAILYLLPFGMSFSVGCYRRAVLATIVGCVLGLYGRQGMPQFNMAYAQRVITDPAVMVLFVSVLLITNRPYVLALGSLFLYELQYVSSQLFEYARANLPAMGQQLNSMIARFAPQMAGQDLNALLTPSTLNAFNSSLLRMAANLEVYQGLFLIFELFLPSRNFMFLFLWFQFLQMKYMIDKSGNTRAAFADLDNRISWLVNHQSCPKAVGSAYGTLKTMLAKQVQMPTGGETRPSLGGMFSKCNIM
jgi:hypothetical protein